MVSQVRLYDALGDDYDRFVNWEARLAHELPFFERLFQAAGVRRVLDAACGTGHHAIALAQRGHKVTGADLSAVMISRARENAAATGVDVAFRTAGLGDFASLGQSFDAVICLGNSLPHLPTAQAVAGAMSDFAAVLAPGGLLVVQNRNFDQVWAERQRFMPPQSYREGEREWLFLRFYDFHESTVTFNMVRLRRADGAWEQDTEATLLRPIFRDELAEALDAAGFCEAAFYGSYDGSAFEPGRSGDLIAVAKR